MDTPEIFEAVQVKKFDKVLVPLNGMIFFIRDKPKEKTNSGIIIPEKSRTDQVTGTIIGIAKDIKENSKYQYVDVGDKVIVNFVGYFPYDLTDNNRKFFIPATSIVAIWKDRDIIPDEEYKDCYEF